MSLTCDFGAVEEGIFASLARRTWSALENSWYFSFDVSYFGWVSDGNKN